jgi:FAD:protein FMN transferase
MNRRRFLALSAAALATSARTATRHDWSGIALRAEARLTLSGTTDRHARHIFARVTAELATIEAQFSLHRSSALTRLNRDGRLAHPSPPILGLFALAARVHTATGGVLDPTIQPLWLATATGGNPRHSPRRLCRGPAGTPILTRMPGPFAWIKARLIGQG